MKKTLWLLACFGIFYGCSCRKTPVEPAFQNSFSCKINGVDWKPEGGTNATGGIKSLNIDVVKYSFFNKINIDALRNIRDSKTGEDIIFEGMNFGINLELNNTTIINTNAFYKFDKNNEGCSRYYSDSVPTNIVKVTELDEYAKIVKGTFEFEAASLTCKKNVRITEGKFEVKY